MQIRKTPRGFDRVEFQDHNQNDCILQQSSAIGDYRDSMANPGSSFLHLGIDDDRPDWMLLDREQVRELTKLMRRWLKTGSLSESPESSGD